MPLLRKFLGFRNTVHAVGAGDENETAGDWNLDNNPKFNWDGNLRTGILDSTPKWTRCLGDDRVSLVDQIDLNGRIALLLEPGMPREKIESLSSSSSSLLRALLPSHKHKETLDASMKAYGYFFTRGRNSAGGTINLLLRSKPLKGEEQPTMFHDITYFGLKFQLLTNKDGYPPKYSCHFVATFEHGQVRLPTGIEFQLSDYKRLDYILTQINRLIASSLIKRSDLNTGLCPFLPINTPDEAMDLPFADSIIIKPSNTETTFTCSYTTDVNEVEENGNYDDDDNHDTTDGLTLKPVRKPSYVFIGPEKIEVLGMEYAITHPSSRSLNDIAAAAMMSRPIDSLSTNTPILAV